MRIGIEDDFRDQTRDEVDLRTISTTKIAFKWRPGGSLVVKKATLIRFCALLVAGKVYLSGELACVAAERTRLAGPGALLVAAGVLFSDLLPGLGSLFSISVPSGCGNPRGEPVLGPSAGSAEPPR